MLTLEAQAGMLALREGATWLATADDYLRVSLRERLLRYNPQAICIPWEECVIKRTITIFGGLLLFRRLLTGYIDPSTGGMLFQALAVVFALISTVVLFFSGRIRMFFSRMRRSARERGSDPNASEQLDSTAELSAATDNSPDSLDG
jgi:hypothetical protein